MSSPDLAATVASIVVLAVVGGTAAWSWVQLRYPVSLPPAPPRGSGSLPSRVSVIIPARNEEANIERCVASYLAQAYSASQIEVIVVDDDSQDQTAEIVKRLAADDGRVRLVSVTGLPDGWLGKPHACWQGYLQATGEWLCFADADTRANADLLTRAVAHAEAHDLDCISLAPQLELHTFWDRVVMPSMTFLVATSAPVRLRDINDDASPAGGAIGAFILVRRTAYEAIGGHRAVANRIVEDLHLGRALTGAGYRLRLMDGSLVLSVRSYSTLGGILGGLSKNLALLAGSTPRALAIAASAFVVPWTSVALLAYGLWALVAGPNGPPGYAAAGLSLAAYPSVVAFHVGVSQRMRVKWWAAHALLSPLSWAVSAAVMVRSVVWSNGRRGTWKGRRVAKEV